MIPYNMVTTLKLDASKTIALFIVVIVCCSVNAAAVDGKTSGLDRVVRLDRNDKGLTYEDAMGSLARQSGIPIDLEIHAERDARNVSILDKTIPEGEHTLRDMLDLIKAKDPQFKWHSRDGRIHIVFTLKKLPDDILSTRVIKKKLTVTRIDHAIREINSGLGSLMIIYDDPLLGRWERDSHIVLTKDMTVREVFTSIARARNACWTAYTYPTASTKVKTFDGKLLDATMCRVRVGFGPSVDSDAASSK